MTIAKKASKKTAKKAAKKKVAKKAAAKKATTKKAAAKKAASKKVAKKATTKKVAKKAATKKAASKKAAKKTTTKKVAKKAAKKTATERRKSPTARQPVVMKIGDPAPVFELDADDGQTYSLGGLAGKRIVLYFYPRDNTPGCTVEACDFRDRDRDFRRENTVVLGVSGDSLASHAKFREKQRLNFPLLADPGNKIAACYGAYGKKKLYGREIVGTIRSTFVISPEGKLEAIYSPVRVKGHADAVLRQVREAGRAAA